MLPAVARLFLLASRSHQQLLPHHQPAGCVQFGQPFASIYQWRGRQEDNQDSAGRQPWLDGQEPHQQQSRQHQQQQRDHNEIRLRGTVTKVFIANEKFCRFAIATKRLHRRVNPGGSWRWAEATVTHQVFGSGPRVLKFVNQLGVGARVDMAGALAYSAKGAADTAMSAAAPAPAPGVGSDRLARIRLIWLKPVEEEELVEVNFNVQLESEQQ